MTEEQQQPRSNVGLGTIIQIVCLIAALGIGYGALKNQVDTMKVNQTSMEGSQTAIFDKLNQMDRRLIRMEAASNADRKRRDH